MHSLLIFFAIFIAFVASNSISNKEVFTAELPIVVDNIPVFRISNEPKSTSGSLSTRIIDGKPAKLQQFPYQVGLQANTVGKLITSWCGGSLISPEWVLTAAHCVLTPTYIIMGNQIFVDYARIKVVPSIDVTLGMTDKSNRNEKNHQEFKVTDKNIIRNTGFDFMNVRDDIALIKLPKPAQLNENVQIIKLPRRSFRNEELLKRTIISSGWGIFSSKQVSPILRYAEFKVLPYKECNALFKKFNQIDVIHDESQLCISAPGKSCCSGDSGGPNAIIEDDGTKVLVGISSFVTNEACTPGLPTALTRVQYYLDWINKYTGIPIEN